MKNTNKYENEKLLKEIKNGNKEALNLFLIKNINFVRNIAIKYQNLGLELDDLVQEGLIGLCEALEKFDLKRNLQFTTYSTYCVKANIFKAVQKKGRSIYLPKEIYIKIHKLKQLINDLAIKLGRFPNLDEIIIEANISKEEFILLYSYFEAPISIYDISLYIDEETENVNEKELLYSLLDNNVDVHFKLELQEMKKLVNNLFKCCDLSENAVKIIKMRYGYYDGKIYKYKEIGDMLGISIQDVYSHEIRALTKFRKHYKIKELVSYLGNESEKFKNIEKYNNSKEMRKKIK